MVIASCSAVATRGTTSGPGQLAFDVIQVVEIDADELMTRVMMFDPDDIDAAFAELDAQIPRW